MKKTLGLFAVLVVSTLLWLPTASAAVPIDPPGGRHTIQRGETLVSIAARYQVSVSAIQNANGIRNANSIRAGATLIIPRSARSSLAAAPAGESQKAPGGSSPASKPSSAQAPAATTSRSVVTGCTNPYYVRKGDTLSTIAQRCGVRSDDLKHWNRLNSGVIYTGQKLVTGGTAAAVTPTPRGLLPQAPRAQQPALPEPRLPKPAAPRPPIINPAPAITPPPPPTIAPPPPPRAPVRPVPTEPIYPRLSP